MKKQNLENIVLVTLIVLGALYLTWHIGRLYEHDQVKNLVVNHLGAEYTDRLVSTGEQVNCITDKNVDTLFQYAGVDY